MSRLAIKQERNLDGLPPLQLQDRRDAELGGQVDDGHP
jgi:hypothetical protein